MKIEQDTYLEWDEVEEMRVWAAWKKGHSMCLSVRAEELKEDVPVTKAVFCWPALIC